MPTVIREQSPVKDVLIQTGGDTQADANVDLGASYQRIVVKATAAEAANLAAGTISLLIDDEEYHDSTGTLVAIAKPAAGVGIHFVADVQSGRSINLVASASPTADFTGQVYGVDPLVIDEAQREFARVWTI